MCKLQRATAIELSYWPEKYISWDAALTLLCQGHSTAVTIRIKQQYVTACILLVTRRWSHICQKLRRKVVYVLPNTRISRLWASLCKFDFSLELVKINKSTLILKNRQCWGLTYPSYIILPQGKKVLSPKRIWKYQSLAYILEFLVNCI